METKNITRLFVAEYESVKTWAKGKSIFKSIKEDDFFLMFKAGKELPPEPMFQELVSEIATQSGVLKDTEQLDDYSYLMFVKQEIESLASKDTYVYFLNMESTYLQLKEELENKVADVQHCDNFSSAGRMRKKSIKTMMGKEKKTVAKPTSETENDELFATMTETIQIDPSVHIPDYDNQGDTTSSIKKDDEKDNNFSKVQEEQENIKEHEDIESDNTSKNDESVSDKSVKDKIDIHKEKNEEDSGPHLNIDKTPKNDDSSKDSKQSNIDKKLEAAAENYATKKTEEPKKEKENNRERTDSSPRRSAGIPPQPSKSDDKQQGNNTTQTQNVRGKKGGPFGNKQQSSAPAEDVSGMSMEELEKLIFGSKIQSVKHEKVYTEIDDARAYYAETLLNRLIANIKKLVRKTEEYNFDDEKFILLINIIIRSYGYEDFIASWDAKMPGYILGIDEKTYSFIYAEAKYYADTCENIYEKDKW